jgi:hypothetical protein
MNEMCMDQEGVEEAGASIRKWMLDFVEEIFYQLAYHIYQPHAFWKKMCILYVKQRALAASHSF